MPSSYTTSARFTLQATGENNNTWGVILNSGVFQLVDDNVNGRLAFNLSGTKVLSTALGATDEARMNFLDVLGGTGGTITVPAVTQGHFVRNFSAGNVTVSAGGLLSATFNTGDAGPTFCDGSNVYPMLIGGRTVRAYIDYILAMTPVTSPPVGGQAGKFLGNDGVGALEWQTSTPLTWTFGGVTTAGIGSFGSVVSTGLGSFAGVNSSALVKVNLGPTAPPASIDAGVGVQLTGATGAAVRAEINAFGTNGQVIGRAANGTAAAPTATQANNGLFFVAARGYGATGWSSGNRAAVGFSAAENYTDTAQGTRIDFYTTANGTTAFTPRWSVDAPGHFIPVIGGAYDVGAANAPVRNLYTTLATVNRSTAAAPAPIDASMVVQGVGATGQVASTELVAYGSFSRFSGRSSAGTDVAPTPTQNGNPLLAFTAYGRQPSGWSNSAGGQIYFAATENWTDTAHGTKGIVQLAANGTLGARDVWVFEADGTFRPGSASAFDIGTPAIPVRNVYATNITSRLFPLAITTPTLVGNIPSLSVVYLGAGGSLIANSTGAGPVPDGHIIFVGNFTGGSTVITQGAGASLSWVNPAGAGLAGNRNVAFAGFVTIAAMNTGWLISGTGIT